MNTATPIHRQLIFCANCGTTGPRHPIYPELCCICGTRTHSSLIRIALAGPKERADAAAMIRELGTTAH